MFPLAYEKKDNVWISVTIERNLDKAEYSRAIYTGFDFLSDVGGLSGLLMSFVALFVAAWNFNSFDNYMASHLFKIKRSGSEIKSGGPENEPIRPGVLPNCREYWESWLPDYCQRKCKYSRRKRALQQARDHLEKEINVI